MLEYYVCRVKFIGCATIEGSENTVEMAKETANFTIKGAFEVGQKYRLKYRFYRTLSRYYDDSGTRGESESVKY